MLKENTNTCKITTILVGTDIQEGKYGKMRLIINEREMKKQE